jgi:hypothetical protein
MAGFRLEPASAAEAGPVLVRAEAQASAPGMITVTGEGFTPGGEVYLAIYDTWGDTLQETRWTTASQTVYGTYLSFDPARGYLSGGAVTESFGGLCGESVIVRAFDQDSGAWSNWLDLAMLTTPTALYGLASIADPAMMGYHPVC